MGGWPEYVRVREERAEAEKAAKRGKPVVKQAPKAAPSPRRRARRTTSPKAKKLEQQIEAAEAALASLEIELADPSAWNDPRTSAKSTARHAEAKKKVEELYARYEAVSS